METAGSQLPKLPKLDQEDIKAVRSFLPGKVLGRTAALLALLALALAYAGVAERCLRAFGIDLTSSTPWVRVGLLLGLPMLIVASQLAIEWRAERNRYKLQRLAVRPGIEQSTYFRIGPYLDTPEDQARFRRADGAHVKILSWIERSRAPLLYITGDSGSGKSSLLRAYVLPSLRAAGWSIIECRPGDADGALAQALANFVEKAPNLASPSLPALMAQAERRSGGKLLLLLDQFEEFLILGTAEQKRSLVGQISDLQSAAQAGRILLVLRSDYQILLDELDMPRLHQDENTFQLGRFTMSAASDFMGRSGLDLHPMTLAEILRSIAELDETPGLVRPIILNIVGYVLAVGRVAEPRNASQVIRQYIEQTIGDPVIRDFAPKVLEQLVTEQGTKLPRSELWLVDATQLRRGEVRAVMNGLGAAALARPLDPLNSVWELSHDFVARAIMRSFARQRRRLLKRSAQFAVPALFVATLSMILMIGAWHRLSPYQTRSELAELGIVVTTSDKELKAELSQHFKAASLPAIVLLLSGLNEPLALDLSSPDVEDIAPLENLPTLRRLSLAHTHVTSLEPLRHLSNLQELDISDAPVRDIAPLEQLTNLRALYLGGLEIQDFHPLERLVSLEDLDLSATKFSDVQPLTKLRNLRALNIRADELSNITQISDLTSLRKLDLSLTNIADLRPLQSLPDLEELALGTGSLERVRSTSSFLSLLTSDSSSLTNFRPLSGIRNLRKLSLSGTNIMNLEPLIDLRKLTDLNLESTKIDSIDVLGEMTSLQRLNIRGTNIEDLQPIQRLTNLEELVIDSSAGEGIEQRLNLPKLHVVRVFSPPI